MVHSNERGRALEYRVAIEIENFIKNDLHVEAISTETTKRLNSRDKKYFYDLDESTKTDFSLCAVTFIEWLKKQNWFDLVDHITIDRFGDDKAKKADPTDIQLYILYKTGNFLKKNFSLKHHHDALCHPRLPSLAQQCGFVKGSKEDVEYREKYNRIWNALGKKIKELDKNIKIHSQVDSEFKFKNLYVPLLENTISFLNKYSKTIECVQTFFGYLVGRTDYNVIKNETKELTIKSFSNIVPPTKYTIIYPYKEKNNDPRNYFLLTFDNGWKIRVRIHNASSRIFKSSGEVFATEKMDPICINIKDLVKLEKIDKK